MKKTATWILISREEAAMLLTWLEWIPKEDITWPWDKHYNQMIDELERLAK